MIIDSHCHLDYSNLFNQLDDIVKRAERNQVNYFLTICTTLESFKRIIIIVEKYKNIYGTFGIHPHETKDFTNVDAKFILDIKNKHKKIIGIGETGLDYYYNHSDKKIQKKSFIEHIDAASQLGIPLIVHSRNAEHDTYEILKSEKKHSNLKILMHCFTGSYNFAKKLMKYNTYFSASGIITFNNSIDLQNTFKKIPEERILIETDSPFLSPVPMRGKKNEPSYIKFTLNKLAELKNVEIDYLDKVTTNNFNKLFF